MSEREGKALLKRLAQRARELRAQAKLSQEAMAERAAMNVRPYQKLESGEVNVTLATLAQLSRALDVDVRDLF